MVSDFGAAAGGSDVDKLFMADIEVITDIHNLKFKNDKEKSIILFNILSNF